MTEQATIPAVRREITVDAPRERAFTVFTEQLGTWWPQDSHHITDMPAEAVMEGRVGGRCYGRSLRTGDEKDWGRVLAWEPPGRVVFAWLLSPQWQYEPDAEKASEVEVTFTDAGDGRTLVVLEHRGFERYAQDGERVAETVAGPDGWPMLLDLYAKGAAQAVP
jgi:uncharacterized protein YndB with AHSA1/START domain